MSKTETRALIYSASAAGAGGIETFTTGLSASLGRFPDLQINHQQYQLPRSRGVAARIATRLIGISHLRQACRAMRPDWIISTEWDPCGYLAELQRKQGSPKTLCVVHGQEIHRIPDGWRGRKKQQTRDWLFARCTEIVAVSSYTADRLRSEGVNRQIEVIGNIAPPPHPQRERKPFEGKRMRMITLARLVERKGHRYAILALAELMRRGVDAEYMVIGVGPEERSLRELSAEAGVSERVRFAGRLSDDDCRQAMMDCDVFVHPNFAARGGMDFEGFGIVLLEAMALGLPVVAGEDGGTRDVVQHGQNGLLVAPESVEGIVDAVMDLRNDEGLLSRVVEGGFETCRQFSAERVGRKYHDILANR